MLCQLKWLIQSRIAQQQMRTNQPKRPSTKPLLPPPEPLPNKELTSKICVMNLPTDIQRYELINLFKQVGTVVDTYIPSHLSGRAAVFGFVLFKTVQEAATAVLILNDTVHFGRAIRVAFAQPKKWNREAISKIAEECACNCHQKGCGKGGQASDGWGEPTRTQPAELPKKKKERPLSISTSFTFSFAGQERNQSNTVSRKRPTESKIKLLLEQRSEAKREKLENSLEKAGEKKMPDGRKENMKGRANEKDDGLALLAISTDISKSELSEDYYSYQAKPFADFYLKKETI